MSTVLGLWHMTLDGGQEKTIHPPVTVHVTNVSFGEEIADTQSRTVVKLKFESLMPDEDESEEKDEEKDEPDLLATTVLCALTPGKIEHASINITLDADSEFTIQVTGKNKVYLSGNYIRQLDDQEPQSDGSDSEGAYDLEEDAYDLREVSSDVEMHPDDLADLESDASRFEEVEEGESPKTAKRPRESDIADETKPESASKKKNKKLKTDEGNALPAPVEEEKKDKKKKDKKDKKDKTPTIETKEKKDDKGEKTPSAKKTVAGGIIIQDAKIGTGPMAKKGNAVRMRYIGKLTNGKEFDRNVSGKPFTFNLGKGEVIKGWDEGIVGMQAGGERVLTIPPNMAYGSKKQDRIPANSTLVFEVKLLEIK
ncbi:hypothetical protein GALMADRAFT_248463 [Galerina marginata CBS 339.88]|uniref:FK506-binding protein n=1 Tax=Galerina marginata (strain CBS 339.88) TaxID=685588 RepID=A0A067T0C0_GALM3|nr:hypothetical protein GALMADRAFT_248463 [Galerina marginata CBS 339.88]